jgi:N-acetylglutamate synthase-like GNAT family acetyltransferase
MQGGSPRRLECASVRARTMFRRATLSDVPALTALINVAYEVERFFKAGDRTDEAEVTDLLDKTAFLVHEADGQVVGCVHVAINGERGYFGLLAVHPSKHRQGLGGRLVAAAEAFGRDAGCRAMDLSVVHLRTELPPYYRALGYAESGSAPFPERHRATKPCHLIVMSKTL